MLIPINVFLAGRSYRIRVHQDEEAMVRRAVKAADEKIMDLRRHYAGKDDQDFIAMALLMYATDTDTTGANHTVKDELQTMISSINKVLAKEEAGSEE